MFTRHTTRLLGAMVGIGLMSAMAGADVVNTSALATANVQSQLTLHLDASPDWGKITRPPTGNAEYLLSYSTGATTVTSGNGYAFSDGAAGQFTLSGAPSAPVSFTVAIGAFSGTVPITVVESHINGLVDTSTDNLSELGTLILKIGGKISVPSNATLAAQTSTVTLTVDYQ